MIRKVIEIDEERCNGCGICADACHEGAIEIIDGKARLTRDDYCDGFGDCLPSCPQGAISFVEREAAAYDEAAVQEAKRRKEQVGHSAAQANVDGKGGGEDTMMGKHRARHAGGCPGTAVRSFDRGTSVQAVPAVAQGVSNETAASQVAGVTSVQGVTGAAAGNVAHPAEAPDANIAPAATSQSQPSYAEPQSQLTNWPVQIKLAPTQAPYFDGANLLIAADCCAYSYAAFHERFIRNRTCVIGCPKLDGTDYTDKLAEIIAGNDVKSVTICRMEVPCCGGLERMATEALRRSGKFIPWQVVTFSLDGRILD